MDYNWIFEILKSFRLAFKVVGLVSTFLFLITVLTYSGKAFIATIVLMIISSILLMLSGSYLFGLALSVTLASIILLYMKMKFGGGS